MKSSCHTGTSLTPSPSIQVPQGKTLTRTLKSCPSWRAHLPSCRHPCQEKGTVFRNSSWVYRVIFGWDKQAVMLMQQQHNQERVRADMWGCSPALHSEKVLGYHTNRGTCPLHPLLILQPHPLQVYPKSSELSGIA